MIAWQTKVAFKLNNALFGGVMIFKMMHNGHIYILGPSGAFGRQRRGPGHSPSSNVEGSVHDHNHLDVQPVPLRGVPSWLVAHKHRILFCICEKRRWGKKGKRKSSQELTGQGEKGGCPQNKTMFKSDQDSIFHLQWGCSFRKNWDRRVLLKDDQVTVSFPDDNKPGLIFLSVTISDLSLFLGLKLASEPFTWRCSFFPSFLFIFFRVLSLRGSLPKILSWDKTISKQPSHQSLQRQCGLEARALDQEPEEKYSLHRRPVGIIYHWRQPC